MKLKALQNKCVYLCLQLDNTAHVGITEFKLLIADLDLVWLQTCLSPLMINVPYT